MCLLGISTCCLVGHLKPTVAKTWPKLLPPFYPFPTVPNLSHLNCSPSQPIHPFDSSPNLESKLASSLFRNSLIHSIKDSGLPSKCVPSLSISHAHCCHPTPSLHLLCPPPAGVCPVGLWAPSSRYSGTVVPASLVLDMTVGYTCLLVHPWGSI